MYSHRALLFILLGLIASLQGADNTNFNLLDKYQTPIPYAGQRNWHVTQNLGVTGARAWVLGERSNTTDSRELVIKSIIPGSPADGVLQPYDIIVGINKTPFSLDARLAFSKALTEAEGSKASGKLKLLCVRDGTTSTFTLQLPVMGDFSKTAPHNCTKTDRIVEQSAATLAKHMPDRGFSGLSGALNAMLLLATEDPAYLDHVRRSAMNMGPNHTISDAGHETWRWGYANTFLCEYYLATGDKRVLPTIQEYADILAKGQCNPGTWGHMAVPDGLPPGYGSMNQSGLVCFLSLILSYQCGVNVDDEAIAKSIRFYGRYAGWGGVPYGDHPAYMSPACNGKNGSAAVAFHLLGAKPARQWFANYAATSNLPDFEAGHTGNTWGQIWTPIAAALAGDINYQNFWSRFNNYRDMARDFRGGFLIQSQPNHREGDLGSRYAMQGPLWATGGLTLGYLGGSNKLAIFGRRESVFGVSAPEALRPALKAYHRQSYDESASLSSSLTSSRNTRVRAMAIQLKTISELNLKSTTLTLASIKKNMTIGNLYLAQRQLKALEALVPANDGLLSPLTNALGTPEAKEIIESRGQHYDSILKGYASHGPRGFQELLAPPVATDWSRKKLRELLRGAKGFYQKEAQAAEKIFGTKPNILYLTKATTITHKTPQVETAFTLENLESIHELRGAWSLKGKMKVTLNGTVILDLKCANAIKETEVVLKPITLELLKKGNNVLKVIGNLEDKALSGSFALKSVEAKI